MYNKVQKLKEDFEWKNGKGTINVPNYGQLFPCNNPTEECGTCFRGWNYEHEHEYIEEIKKILPKNSIGLDIGAHTGTYSIALKEYIKKMYSFEPYIYAYEALVKNSVLYPNIIPMYYACGAECVYEEAAQVPVIDLEYFFSSGTEDPNFIKLDIEGQEIDVLNELAPMIKRTDYLIMLVEFEPKHFYPRGLNELDFFKALKNCGLDCTQLWEEKIKPIFKPSFFSNIIIEKKNDSVNAKMLTYCRR